MQLLTLWAMVAMTDANNFASMCDTMPGGTARERLPYYWCLSLRRGGVLESHALLNAEKRINCKDFV